MAKNVELPTGRVFTTISAAKEHFATLLESQGLKEPFSGQDLEDVKAVYDAYCKATKWPLDSEPSSFYPTEERGPGYTTRCYGVSYADGNCDSFSMPKALSAIAKP